MKRSLFVVCLAAVVAFLSTPSFAQSAHLHGGKANLPVSTPLVVGSTTLQPGEYKIQCLTADGKEYLVVTSVATGKEAARVPCKSETLDKKVTESSVLTTAGADGAKKLVGLRIKGETSTHTVTE
jgi:hypothetical protein